MGFTETLKGSLAKMVQCMRAKSIQRKKKRIINARLAEIERKRPIDTMYIPPTSYGSHNEYFLSNLPHTNTFRKDKVD